MDSVWPDGSLANLPICQGCVLFKSAQALLSTLGGKKDKIASHTGGGKKHTGLMHRHQQQLPWELWCTQKALYKGSRTLSFFPLADLPCFRSSRSNYKASTIYYLLLFLHFHLKPIWNYLHNQHCVLQSQHSSQSQYEASHSNNISLWLGPWRQCQVMLPLTCARMVMGPALSTSRISPFMVPTSILPWPSTMARTAGVFMVSMPFDSAAITSLLME